MKEELFRKKSLERISSPEQLNDYIKVSNPGVWMILSAVIVLLVGMCVWGIFGKLNTVLTVPALSSQGEVICYVKEADVSEIVQGMTVEIGEAKYPVIKVESVPLQVTADFEEYILYIGGFKTGEWVYEIVLDAELQDGVYEAEIITESIAPMSFLVN